MSLEATGSALEKRRAYQAAYRALHPDYMVTYRAAHREEKRRWRAAHAEKNREIRQRRRVRLRGGFVERVDLAVLVARDGGYCGICHKRVAETERSIDHVLPVSKGGTHSYANTRLAHLAFNIERGNRGAAQLRLVG